MNEKPPDNMIRKFMSGKLSRRDFIAAGGAAGITLFCYIFGKPIADEARAIVSKKVHEAFNSEENKYDSKLISKLFGDFQENYKFTPGTAHYLFPGRMHPDDVIAGSTLERVGIAGIEKLEIVDSFFPIENFTGNLVALGGPMSNYISRQALDYIPTSSAPIDGFARKKSKCFFELPYEYAFSHTKSYAKLKTERIDASSVLRDLENDTLLEPETDPSGHLTSDYLLITVLPNILSKKAYDEGNKMIVFGGTHGVGTRAIDLLFQDSSALQTLVRKVHGVNYWQAVIEVVEIIKPTRKERAKPFAISQEIRCRPVHLNESEIENHIKA